MYIPSLGKFEEVRRLKALRFESLQASKSLRFRSFFDTLEVSKFIVFVKFGVESYRHNPRLIEWVTAILFKAWKFKRWTDSRWVTMSLCCRTTLRSVLLGMRSLTKYLFDSGKQWHVRGFHEHCSSDVLEMCAVVSLSSFALDSFLITIMKDDRLPAQLRSIHAKLKQDQKDLNFKVFRLFQCLQTIKI